MNDIDTDILIVGAGLAGAATAYHLARLGRRRVILVDKEETAGVHSSGRNVGLVRERMENPALQEIASAGAAFLRTGALASYERCGLMLLGLGDDDVQPRFATARGHGLWCPNDGTVDVAGLLEAYLAGQDVRFGVEVLGFERSDSGMVVRTSKGSIACGVVVNAAGPWAGTLGDLPLTPMKRHLFVTPPIAAVDPHWPFVWDVAGHLYFRPESGGLLLCACDETAAAPGDYSEDPAVLEDLAEKLSTLQPGLGELSVLSSWVGQRVFAPDRRFVIGFDPRNDRMFHVAGLGGHGVTTSHAVGSLASALILGRTDGAVDAEPFSPTRLVHSVHKQSP